MTNYNLVEKKCYFYKNRACITFIPMLIFLFLTVATVFSDFDFQAPFGIAVKNDGSFYVAEIQGKRISKFDRDGNFTGEIKYIEGYGHLKGPFDVDFGQRGNIYITDTLGHCVLVLDPNENLILQLGTGKPSSDLGSLHQPHFSVPNEQSKLIFVSDTHNHRIQVFDTAGNPLKIIGEAGTKNEPDTYDFSSGITFDKNNNIYVMSLYGGTINVYNDKYQLINCIGERGYKAGHFHAAYGISYHDNAIWVADTRNSRLQKMSPDGKVLTIIDNDEGDEPNQLNNPTDIEFDSDGNIFITDWKNNRIVKYDSNGNFLQKWGKYQSKEFNPPLDYRTLNIQKPIDVAIYGGIGKDNVDAAAKAGVKWIYVSIGHDDQQGIINPADTEWEIKEMVDYAHKKGIKVSAYVGIYRMGVELPRWQSRPEFYMWKKGADAPGKQALSYYFPEVRSWKVKHIVKQVKKSGVDGLLLDYIRYPNNLMGYEPAMVKAFKDETGRNAYSIPKDDWEWLKFRAKYITDFISELKHELELVNSSVVLSVYVGPDWKKDLKMVVRNWRDWIDMDLVDMVCLGEYSRNFRSFYESVRQARSICQGRAKISIVIACWGGNLYNAELLKKGADTALAAAPDEIAIYRGDAINKLNLWNAIGDIATCAKEQ